MQFLGYKFGLKGSTYTRENTVIEFKFFLACQFLDVACRLALGMLLFYTSCEFLRYKGSEV